MLYIIFILDITSIYHDELHQPEELLQCSKSKDTGRLPDGKCDSTSAMTFVDDNIVTTKAKYGKSIQQAVLDAISRIQDYTNANLLALNPEKSRVMIMTKNTQLRKDFQVPVSGKVLHHQPALTILGNIVTEDLSWDRHVTANVIPSLANRVRTLKNISQYMGMGFRKQYATAIFRGKLAFAADTWGGVCQTLISKVQLLQDRAAKVVLGHPFARKSCDQRLS